MEGEVADTIGYDGVFFYGMTASVADMVSMRFGFNHHCSHYGDGTYKILGIGNEVPQIDEWFKYLRMDSMMFGLSIDPVEYVRLYADINFNLKSTSVLPSIFSPIWTVTGGGSAEGMPASYGARIVNFGIELQYPIFKDLGETRLSYNCRAYEEGKIVYKEEDLAAAGKEHAFYDPDRPWEFEHTINLSQDINDLVSFDVTWHYGRFILNSYYATRSSYVSLGARLNFDSTVTLYDSTK